MTSEPSSGTDRIRESVIDVLVLVGATALAAFAVLEFGVPGLVAGTILLTVAGIAVIHRQAGTYSDPGRLEAEDFVVDGGHRDS